MFTHPKMLRNSLVRYNTANCIPDTFLGSYTIRCKDCPRFWKINLMGVNVMIGTLQNQKLVLFIYMIKAISLTGMTLNLFISWRIHK